MRIPNHLFRGVAPTIAAAVLLAAIGCSDDSGIGKRYKVYGKVTYKGAPVAKGVINFVPEEAEGRGATGQIENGQYSLTTVKPGDGALPGKYKVTIDTRQVDDAKLEAQAKKEGESKGVTYSMVPQELQAKALQEAKGTIPGKYQIPETTDLKAEVTSGSNTIDFELKD